MCLTHQTCLPYALSSSPQVHPEVGNLTQLRSLDLSSNPIRILPLEIGYITNLTSFQIDVEKLLVPPPEIAEQGVNEVLDWIKLVADMRKTEDGALSGRGLTHLPLEVSWVTVLTQLDLSNNSVVHLHPECSTLVHLTDLNLMNNELETLPESIASFTGVTFLNLDNNQLIRSVFSFETAINITNMFPNAGMIIDPVSLSLFLRLYPNLIFRALSLSFLSPSLIFTHSLIHSQTQFAHRLSETSSHSLILPQPLQSA